MKKKVRIGLVGAGFVSHIHINAFRQVIGIPVEVAGIYTRSRGEEFAQKYGIPRVYESYQQMLEDPDIDMVDICVPNIVHREVCIQAAEAGKHIICEKPLTGAFGENITNQEAGDFSRLDLYKEAMKNADAILAAAQRNKVKVCYAEDFIYAPVVVKTKRLLKQSGGSILEIRSEESHSGSHAAYSRHWNLAGGGSLLRLGSHPLGLAIHLKHFEGKLKYGKPMNIKSVIADVATLTHTQAFKNSGKAWMVDKWDDVEDWATVVLTFEDGTKALINSNDTTLGGIVNTLDVYTTNSVIKCDMAANDAIKAYAPANEIFGDEYISEKIETKAGWTFPSPDEDWMRGYPQEMQDFVEAVYFGREPISDGELGRQVVQATYAAYLSAEQGKRIDLAELDADIDRNKEEESR
ncbi:MAG TPA: oxidoreductase [Firmicutes bacterium]|mgnify:FL=1|nr:oxidoreductase [Bacillota bacterium]